MEVHKEGLKLRRKGEQHGNQHQIPHDKHLDDAEDTGDDGFLLFDCCFVCLFLGHLLRMDRISVELDTSNKVKSN